MSTDTLTKTIIINAAPDVVWEFLVNKDKLGIWFHPARADLAPGEDFELFDKSNPDSDAKICWGHVSHMQAPARLDYSFTVKPLGGGTTDVSWTLEAVSGGTRLTLVHTGIANAAGDAALGLLTALDKGWDNHFATLRDACAA